MLLPFSLIKQKSKAARSPSDAAATEEAAPLLKTHKAQMDALLTVLENSQPPYNMGAAETLGSFLSWGMENYPADKYITVLRDRGGGSVAGCCGGRAV